MTRFRLILSALILLSAAARADERLFTFSYQSTTVRKGAVEFENWVTYKPSPSGSEEDRFEFRHELEFGLTDRLQFDVYLADWSWTDPGGSNDLDYEDSAVVLKVNYLDPSTEGFGLASYHEVKLGDELFELENKLILQKNIDRWTLVGNLTLEALWLGEDYDEDEGELVTSLGAAYEVSPKFFAGLEAVHEYEIADWQEFENAGLFAGPTLSYRFGGEHSWWVTGSFVKQVTSVDDEPDWQARAIVGFTF
jgi:hypothetical protein